jgi:hypothetical protein
MFVRTVLLTGFLAIGVTAAAFADGDKLPAASVPQATSQLQSQGFAVTKVKPDDGGYKVKGVNAAGQKEKFQVSPNGTVLPKGD